MRLTKEILEGMVRVAVRDALKEVVEGKEDKGVARPLKTPFKGDKPAHLDTIDLDATYLRAIIKQEFENFLKKYRKITQSRPIKRTGCRSDDVINFVRTYEKAAKGK